jgi:glycine betaine/proline transport system substrate-binding protein
LARINFPENDWTDTAEASGLTDYPSSPLQKLASKKLMDANDPFTRIIKNFKWTNDDQNGVAADIEGGMSAEEAAQKWIAANRSTADSWLK